MDRIVHQRFTSMESEDDAPALVGELPIMTRHFWEAHEAVGQK